MRWLSDFIMLLCFRYIFVIGSRFGSRGRVCMFIMFRWRNWLGRWFCGVFLFIGNIICCCV